MCVPSLKHDLYPLGSPFSAAMAGSVFGKRLSFCWDYSHHITQVLFCARSSLQDLSIPKKQVVVVGIGVYCLGRPSA